MPKNHFSHQELNRFRFSLVQISFDSCLVPSGSGKFRFNSDSVQFTHTQPSTLAYKVMHYTHIRTANTPHAQNHGQSHTIVDTYTHSHSTLTIMAHIVTITHIHNHRHTQLQPRAPSLQHLSRIHLKFHNYFYFYSNQEISKIRE